jgi:apolipoprotein N-acyltransferase
MLGLRKPAASPESAIATLMQDNLSVGAQASAQPETPAALIQDFTKQTLHPAISAPAAALMANTAGAGVMGPKTEVVLWPEAPTDFMSGDPRFREAMGDVARATHAPVIVDSVAVADARNSEGRFDEFVSASFFLPDGSYAGRYDKMHLVPFGEYTPYKSLFFFAGHLLDGLNFVPGTQRSLFDAEGHKFGVFICYESIFGDEIREFPLHGAQVLANLSDDGWYGDTSAPWEHLDMARMRAIENARWVLRDTNTGLTASIDPFGRIVAQMPRHVRGAVEVPFDYRNDLTFYTVHGDWIAWLCTMVSVSVLLGSYLQRRYPYKDRATK